MLSHARVIFCLEELVQTTRPFFAKLAIYFACAGGQKLRPALPPPIGPLSLRIFLSEGSTFAEAVD